MLRTKSLLLTITLTCCTLFAGSVHFPPKGFLLKKEAVVSAAKKLTPEKFPNADRILVDDHVLEEYSNDGTSVYWDDDYTKILTEKGRRENTSHTFPFNVCYSTSFVYRAEIIKPDGKTIPIDTRKYTKVMTEQSQMNMNIYDPNNKVLVLSTPGIEIGDICHIIYCRINHKPRMKGTWADYSVFEYDSPIVKLDYEIIEPPELPITHRLIRAPVKDTVTYSSEKLTEGRTRHLWKVRNVPRMFPEPDMPPLHTQVQRLLLSTVRDWETVSRWYWELCREPMSRTTPEMEAKVDELTRGITGFHDKIRAIFKFVSQNIRYMGITTEDEAPGYEPHPVDMTFNNRYGVCRDKAALLTVMLRLAGIPAYPVLIHAGARMDPDVPVPYFNHAITAAADPDGGYILMDATDENTKELFPAYLCNRSYLVAREKGETLLTSEVYPAEKNMMGISSEGSLDANGNLLLKTSMKFGGINDNAYRGFFLRNRKEQQRRFFEAALKKRLAGAEVLECTISPENLQDTAKPLSVKLISRIRDYPLKGEDLEMLIIPWLSPSVGYINFVIETTGLDKRRYPMKTDIPCGVKEKVTLDISKRFKQPYSIPGPFAIDQSELCFSLRHEFSEDCISATVEQKIKVPEFSPEEYSVLKKNLRAIEAESRKRPLFVSDRKQQHDHETLFSRKRTVLHNPHCWTTTAKWSKRILSYAGKKKNSELKFSFNPAWENIEVLSATVSNTNGRVFNITDKEINLMDAGWTASAPRYPAEKKLIVNLPGVEPGSVITVETKRMRTNAVFYAGSVAFGGTSPSADESFEISWPKEMKAAIRNYNLEGYVRCSTVTNSDTISMCWSSDNPPLLESEKHTPPRHFDHPQVFISFGNWKDYTASMKKSINAALNKSTMAGKRSSVITEKADSSYNKILTIRNYVLRNIRIAGPSFLKLPLNSVSDADTTLEDEYGNKLDRAVLLSAMLTKAGFDPEIILAASNRTRYPESFQPDIDIPQPDFFKNPLVKVNSGSLTYYLNDGDQYTEMGVSHFHNAPFLDMEGMTAYVEIPEDKRTRTEKSVSIEIDSEGTAVITTTNYFYGTKYGPFRKRYKEILPEDRRRRYMEIIDKVARSAEAITPMETHCDSFPGYLTYSVKATDYAVIENGILTLSIPFISGNIFPASDDTRSNPLFLSTDSTSKLVYSITLPEDYSRTVIMPESKEWQLPCGTGSMNFDTSSFRCDNGRTIVRIQRDIRLSSGEIPPELYPALLEYNRLLNHPSMRTIVAEKD
ncbi:MAG: DUF3857 domain-containing protein [Kiritimatiellia bacterium]